MAPAHPHATGVAVYPALFQFKNKDSFVILRPERKMKVDGDGKCLQPIWFGFLPMVTG